MLTLRDCLDFCDLSEDVVEAIAEHDHLPPILAAELATCLAAAPGGMHVIHRYMCDNAAASAHRGDGGRQERRTGTLARFEADHPEVRPGSGRLRPRRKYLA
jgi:hypothetical protein